MRNILGYFWYHIKIVATVFLLFGILTLASFGIGRLTKPAIKLAQTNIAGEQVLGDKKVSFDEFRPDSYCYSGHNEIGEWCEEICVFTDGREELNNCSSTTNDSKESQFVSGDETHRKLIRREASSEAESSDEDAENDEETFDNKITNCEIEVVSGRVCEICRNKEGTEVTKSCEEGSGSASSIVDNSERIVVNKSVANVRPAVKRENTTAQGSDSAEDNSSTLAISSENEMQPEEELEQELLLRESEEENLTELEQWELLLSRQNETTSYLTKLIDDLPEGGSVGIDQEVLVTLNQKLEDSLSDMNSLIVDTETIIDFINDELATEAPEEPLAEESTTTESTSNLEGEVLEEVDDTFEIYAVLKNAVDMRLNLEEMLEEVWEFELAVLNLDQSLILSEEQTAELNQIKAKIEELESLRTDAEDISDEAMAETIKVRTLTTVEASESEIKLQDLDETIEVMKKQIDSYFQEFWDLEAWSLMGQLWRDTHILNYSDKMTIKLSKFEGDIAELKSLIAEVEEIRVRDSYFGDIVEMIQEIILIAEENISQFNNGLEETLTVEEIVYIWEIMEELGSSLSFNIEKLMNFFAENPSKFDELTKESQELLYSYANGQFAITELEFPNDFEEYEVDNVEYQIFQRAVKDNLEEGIIWEFTANEFEEIAGYSSRQEFKAMLNNLEIFGDMGRETLLDTAEVYAALENLDMNFINDEYANLSQRNENVLIQSELADEFLNLWNTVSESLIIGDEEKLENLKTELETLLQENKNLSLSGDTAYQFLDVKLIDQDWYYQSVISMMRAGIVSGFRDKNGELTGYYGPEKNVTLAEALKMGLEAAGAHIVPSDGDHWAQKAGYVLAAREIGLGRLINLVNLDRYATREEVAVIIVEAFGFDADVAYRGVFNDYEGRFGGHVQAAYDMGIFSGDGLTGDFDGDEMINRASIAKVINFAMKAVEIEEFIDSQNS